MSAMYLQFKKDVQLTHCIILIFNQIVTFVFKFSGHFWMNKTPLKLDHCTVRAYFPTKYCLIESWMGFCCNCLLTANHVTSVYHSTLICDHLISTTTYRICGCVGEFRYRLKSYYMYYGITLLRMAYHLFSYLRKRLGYSPSLYSLHILEKWLPSTKFNFSAMSSFHGFGRLFM